ncbi:GBF-interacting protein 1-like isoform X2 [Aristolochia californica]|uniref:GBF-interacting protein 1-like isoform X2 n=1 Tax=Aristolochia californica TaxID=171875 RepID=UPI0035DA1F68
MVSGPRFDGGTPVLPAPVRKTIQSIKEIVGNHSDADIYSMLKETNMDPNETAQKLLNQDPFHEVKRKRDKKKENVGDKDFVEPRNVIENTRQVSKPQISWDCNARRGVYYRPLARGISREFRVVRDNRVNQNVNGDTVSEPAQCSPSAKEQVKSSVSDKRNIDRQYGSQGFNGTRDFVSGRAIDADSYGARRQVVLGEKRPIVPSSTLRASGQKPQNTSASSLTFVSSNSAVGLYSKSTDPVHVPSPDSRSSGKVGTIKREFGAVGVHRQFVQNSVAHSSQNNPLPVPSFGKDGLGSTESPGQFSSSRTKSGHLSQVSLVQSVVPGTSTNRFFLSNQQNNKPHQQAVGHQKAPQPNMEWKPKSSKKLVLNGPGVIGKPLVPTSSSADNTSATLGETSNLPAKLLQVKVSEKQPVVIPQHLRVAEADRSRLTFGSFEAGFDSTKGSSSGLQGFTNLGESKDEPAASTSLSNPVASSEDITVRDEIDILNDQIGTSRSQSPSEGSEHSLPDRRESSSSQSLDNYGLVRSESPPYGPTDSQQENDPDTIPSFPGYDSQSGYDVPFFRPAMDESLRGHGLASPQALSSHSAISGPPTTVAMVQQQQPVAQLYPQVHISPFPNFMPYRQILSPVYVPPMAVPSYSSNPAYTHPSNGNSYVIMPGGSSHLTTGNLKYSPSQYKPVPAAGHTGYGNYNNTSGYAMSTPGSVGGSTGIEDVSQVKYKEGNLFVPNPLAETSEMWIQTPRELPGMQTAPYYNMSGQAPHATYVPSHAAAASYNAAPTQPGHVPFSGLYHPSQQATMTNPHHLVHQQLPAMAGNVGVSGPGPQLGAYQQPQLGHLNWTSNF